MPIPSYNPLIRPSELAKLLDLSESQVYRLAQRGVIPSYRAGSTVRFDAAEVLAAIRRENP